MQDPEAVVTFHSRHRMTCYFLQAHFHLGLKEAATKLGVCATTLKRKCRKHGVKAWPSREIKKYNKAMAQIQAVHSAGGAAAAALPAPPPQLTAAAAAAAARSGEAAGVGAVAAAPLWHTAPAATAEAAEGRASALSSRQGRLCQSSSRMLT